MSLHLIECVRPLKLGASSKLALMAFADSADAHTQIAFPGLEAIMEWANVSKSQAQALVSDLAAEGYLRKHRAGHRGRRAEYIVFPEGCCDAHPRPGADASPASVADLAAALGVPVDQLDADQIAALESVLARQVVDVEMPPADRTQPAQKATGTPDSSHGKASEQPDPFALDPGERVRPAGTNRRKATGKGPAHRTPSLTTTTSPPTPHASGAGREPCPAHKPTGTFADNCRGCGTTPRQIRKRTERQAAIDAATQAGPRCPGGHRWAADGSCGCPPPVEHPARPELEQAVAS